MIDQKNGNQDRFTQASDYNALVFVFNQLLKQKSTAKIVRVESVGNGSVNVKPLVNLLDGNGKPHDQGVLFNLPFVRLQGGNKGVICDPQKGDIGLAVFCDRDISNVVNAKAEANPASYRVMSISDGVYLFGLLNPDPTQYLSFSGGNVEIKSPSTQISGNLSVSTGATGTFATPTGQIVSVLNGIVVSIT